MSVETHSTVLKHHFDSMEQQRASERLGMWMFLVTEVLFFAGLFTAYAAYRIWYPEAFAAVSSRMNVLLASINTFVLLTSSLTITLAIRSARLGLKGQLVRNLLLTAFLGCLFLGFKSYEYYVDFQEGLVPGTLYVNNSHVGDELRAEGIKDSQAQLFLSFYYVMTGIHCLHLIIGVGLVLYLVGEVYRGKVPPEAYTTIELTSLYWHLVDIIWLFLMPLVYLAGPHTLSQLHF